MQNDETVKNKICSEFGDEVYKSGILDTKFLAEKIFSNKNNVDKINSIVHPPTLKKINQLTFDILKNTNLVFVESALIYEAAIENMFDYVILIYSDLPLRLKRVLNRDKVEAEKVEQRIKFQIPDENKKESADFVIENNSGVEELKQRTQFVLNLLSSLSGSAK